MLSSITSSGRPWGFTVGVGNEFSDNFASFATPSGLTEAGTDWINTWTHGVLDRIAKVDKRIPVMLQDSFFGEKYWSPFVSGAEPDFAVRRDKWLMILSGTMPIPISSSTRTSTSSPLQVHTRSKSNHQAEMVPALLSKVILPTDHRSRYVAPAVCGQAEQIGKGDGKFPVFIGEWSLQSLYNNTLEGRKLLYDTQIYAYSTYGSGGAFWNGKMLNSVDQVDGIEEERGTLQDYWSWERIADAGIPSADGVTESYC